tara:strand:- start:96 stop:650 length:555 start_codon:yes stop_codon:yes gene_type:complete
MALSKIDVANMLTGVAPLANGGTGATSFTAGITEADEWRVTSDFTTDDLNPIANNWERNDNNFEKIGTGVSVSSGTWSFPSTGKWQIFFQGNWVRNGQTGYTFGKINISSDSGSNYSTVAQGHSACANLSTNTYQMLTAICIVDITNISTHKIQFAVSGQADVIFQGNSGRNSVCAKFTKLGDT